MPSAAAYAPCTNTMHMAQQAAQQPQQAARLQTQPVPHPAACPADCKAVDHSLCVFGGAVLVWAPLHSACGGVDSTRHPWCSSCVSKGLISPLSHVQVALAEPTLSASSNNTSTGVVLLSHQARCTNSSGVLAQQALWQLQLQPCLGPYASHPCG